MMVFEQNGEQCFCPGVAQEWRGRNGSQSRICLPVENDDWDAALLELGALCKQCGWEGHKGEWWRYVWADVKSIARKMRIKP